MVSEVPDEKRDEPGELVIEAFEDEQVAAVAARLAGAGIKNAVQPSETCCFARQNKVIVHDPDGTMWEWYGVLEDSPCFCADPREHPKCCA